MENSKNCLTKPLSYARINQTRAMACKHRKTMTPLAIEILLHFHVSPLPHLLSAYPAVAAEIESQLSDGLIRPAKKDTVIKRQIAEKLT